MDTPVGNIWSAGSGRASIDGSRLQNTAFDLVIVRLIAGTSQRTVNLHRVAVLVLTQRNGSYGRYPNNSRL